MAAQLFPTPKGDTPWVLRKAIERLIAAYNSLVTDVNVLNGNPKLYFGYGSPEGVVSAVPGSIYTDGTDTAAPVIWHKGSGGGNTGWL
jgi:hypothetical protein